MTKPILFEIKNGWLARGDGWAVRASTPEEAISKYREAEQRHREIDARPFVYEQQQPERPAQPEA